MAIDWTLERAMGYEGGLMQEKHAGKGQMSTPKRLSGSSVARIAGSMMRGYYKPFQGTYEGKTYIEANDAHTDEAWRIALRIAKLADDFDAARAEGKE